MTLGMKTLAAVEGDGVAEVRPDEAVDRVPRQLGIDAVRVPLGQEHRRVREDGEAFVETLGLRLEPRRFAQMPLSDVKRVIARRLPRPGDRTEEVRVGKESVSKYG